MALRIFSVLLLFSCDVIISKIGGVTVADAMSITKFSLPKDGDFNIQIDNIVTVHGSCISRNNSCE